MRRIQSFYVGACLHAIMAGRRPGIACMHAPTADCPSFTFSHRLRVAEARSDPARSEFRSRWFSLPICSWTTKSFSYLARCPESALKRFALQLRGKPAPVPGRRSRSARWRGRGAHSALLCRSVLARDHGWAAARNRVQASSSRQSLEWEYHTSAKRCEYMPMAQWFWGLSRKWRSDSSRCDGLSYCHVNTEKPSPVGGCVR